MRNAELKKRLRLSCLIILVAGLCGAILIYLFAEDVPDDSLGYVTVNGTLYPLATRDSKKYRREVKRIGGKAALLFDDFNRRFAELWQGKALAKTERLPGGIRTHWKSAAFSRRTPTAASRAAKRVAPCPRRAVVIAFYSASCASIGRGVPVSQGDKFVMASLPTIALEGTYLHVQPSGDFTYQDRLDFWRKVVKTCEEHQCFDILGESSRTKPLEAMQAYDIFKVFNRAGVTRKHRIAWVAHNPSDLEPMLFTETVLKNRTFSRVKAFSDVASAKHWLLNT